MRLIVAAWSVAVALVSPAASASSPAPSPSASAAGAGDGDCASCTVRGDEDGSGIAVTITSPGAAAPGPATSAGPAPAAPVAAGGGPPQPTRFNQLQPICFANVTEDAPCLAAYTCPDPAAYRAWVYVGPTLAGPFTRTEQQVCTGGAPGAVTAAAPPATTAALVAALTDHFPLDPPVLTVNPSAPAVVQLPVILSTQPQVAHAVEGEELGVAYTAQLTPHWHWAFDQPAGSTLQATTSGTAYDGTDPVEHPDHYLLHTFTRRGTATITCTVTWTVTAVRRDTGDTFTVPDAVRTARSTVEVREGRAELTTG